MADWCSFFLRYSAEQRGGVNGILLREKFVLARGGKDSAGRDKGDRMQRDACHRKYHILRQIASPSIRTANDCIPADGSCLVSCAKIPVAL